jgi:hypothetical protein
MVKTSLSRPQLLLVARSPLMRRCCGTGIAFGCSNWLMLLERLTWSLAQETLFNSLQLMGSSMMQITVRLAQNIVAWTSGRKA